ncbi:MAG: hypothetical protein HY922_13085 [Elusimicrobia bacterium]|nr:hypothetical protein [Elusimicrobiota bacterium]
MKYLRLVVPVILAVGALCLLHLSAVSQSSKRSVKVGVVECPSSRLLLQGPNTARTEDLITLTWVADNVANLAIDGIGEVAGESIQIKPSGKGKITYTLRGINCSGAAVSSSKTITLTKGRVFLNGSLYISWPTVAGLVDLLMPYVERHIAGVYNDSRFRTTEESLANYREYADAVKTWPPSAEAFHQAHTGGTTDVIDEAGNVLGKLDSWALYFGGGIPGLSYLGNPWGSGDLSKVFSGGAAINIDGASYEIVGWMMTSPIILDLDDNGKPDVDQGQWLPHPARFNKSKALAFDINGDGFKEISEWIGRNDGLLAAPVKDGGVKGGNELFGNPIGFVDGYQKLGLRYDKDQNGVVEGKELEGLMVWVDDNRNGKTEPQELRAVQAAGITAISAVHENLKSSFVINGQKRATWDWWPTCMLVYPSMLAKGK